MFWDKVAKYYDLFETAYNGKVNRPLCDWVSSFIDKDDTVLECACGTGMLSIGIGQNCDTLTALDLSENMLTQAKKKCAGLSNVTFSRADITKLPYADGMFDKVVAGNVLHLLDDPDKALHEWVRVCKTGGWIIVPTYVNKESAPASKASVRLWSKLGADFKRQFDFSTYQAYFAARGYRDVEYILVEGRMPCAIAVITKI